MSIPVLKAPGFKRLKPQYDGTLFNFAFNFNSSRYIEGSQEYVWSVDAVVDALTIAPLMVWRCRFTL